MLIALSARAKANHMNNKQVIEAAEDFINSAVRDPKEALYLVPNAKYERLADTLLLLEQFRAKQAGLEEGLFLTSAYISVERAFMTESEKADERLIDLIDQLLLACFHSVFDKDGRLTQIIKSVKSAPCFCLCHSEEFYELKAALDARRRT